MSKSTNNDILPQLTYIGQLLWLISGQLHALTGGGDFAVPDAASLLAPEPPQAPQAAPTLASLAARMKGGAPDA